MIAIAIFPSWSKRSLYQICVRTCLHTLLQLTLLHLTQACSSTIRTQVCGGGVNNRRSSDVSVSRIRPYRSGLQAHSFLGLVLVSDDDVTSFKQAGPAASSLSRAALSVLGLIVLSQIMSNWAINTSCVSC